MKNKLEVILVLILFVGDMECGCGVVKDNVLKVVVISILFCCWVEKVKKGKGSYLCKMKYKGKEFYVNFMDFVVFV